MRTRRERRADKLWLRKNKCSCGGNHDKFSPCTGPDEYDHYHSDKADFYAIAFVMLLIVVVFFVIAGLQIKW